MEKIKIGDRIQVLNMNFYVYKQTYTVNDKKCFLAAANGIKEVGQNLIIQENGFIYGSNVKVKPVDQQENS